MLSNETIRISTNKLFANSNKKFQWKAVFSFLIVSNLAYARELQENLMQHCFHLLHFISCE